jgi:hypothetical protein
MIEWFAPGTEPQRPDTWQTGGRIALPAEYAEWSASHERDNAVLVHDVTTETRAPANRILSPLDGDRYERPPGVDARYVSIPLVVTDQAMRSTGRWMARR